MSQNKKTRKTRTRFSRGTTQREDLRFGTRYLHYHMFTKRNGDENLECLHDVDCKCGTVMSSVYSGKIIVAMTFSIVFLLVGITFILVGHLIPRRPLVYLEKNDGTKLPLDHKAVAFNTMLDDFTLTGTVLLSVGSLSFSVLLIVPICRSSLHRRGEYSKAPTDEGATSTTTTTDNLIKVKNNQTRGSLSEGTNITSSSDTLQKIPVLALVHNIQTQKPLSVHHVQPMATGSATLKDCRMKTARK